MYNLTKFYIKILLIVTSYLLLISDTKASTTVPLPPPSIALPIPDYVDATSQTLTSMECLTLNIYFESRGESYLGQEATAHVVMNRVADPRFPDTVCEVVFQKGWSKKYRKWVPHLSWTLDRKSDKVYEKEAYYIAHMLAVKVYAKLYEYDPTYGSTHYHTSNIEPVWSLDSKMELVAEYGLHKFYRYLR